VSVLDDRSVMIPVRIYSAGFIYTVSSGYKIENQMVEFIGHRDVGRGKGIRITIPVRDVEWFEFRGGGVQALRCAGDEVRNIIFREWVRIRAVNKMSWSDYLQSRMDEIYVG
jgi:hypothetical protein